MPKAILLVQSQPSDPSREDEYNKWYDATHLPQVCDVPGIVTARRYELAPTSAMPAPPDDSSKYIAIYEIEADDLDTVLAEIVTRSGDGRIEMSDVLAMDPMPVTQLYLLRD
jgi:hypothetical protein